MTKAEQLLKDLKAEVARLEVQVAKQVEKIDIFKQPGVKYEVWDSSGRPTNPSVSMLARVDDDGGLRFGNPDGSCDFTWRNHKLVFPQWIDIPDEMMEEPEIKGRYLIELENGEINKEWQCNPMWSHFAGDPGRIKRICILEEQS